MNLHIIRWRYHLFFNRLIHRFRGLLAAHQRASVTSKPAANDGMADGMPETAGTHPLRTYNFCWCFLVVPTAHPFRDRHLGTVALYHLAGSGSI